MSTGMDLVPAHGAGGVPAIVQVLDEQPVTIYLPRSAVLGQWRQPGHPAQSWLANQQRDATRETYGRHLRDFALWLARERDKADPLLADFDDALAYRQELESRGLQATTRVSKLAALSSLYTFLVQRHILEVSPLAGLHLPQTGDSRARRAWTLTELGAFFATIPNDGRVIHLRDRALLWLIFRNGLRVSEVVGARIGDMMEKHGLRVLELREHGVDDQHIKGGYARDAVLKSETCQVVDAYLAARGLHAGAELVTTARGGEPARSWREWPLFTASHDAGRPGRAQMGDGGRRLSRVTVWQRVQVYGRRAGLDPAILFPHAGRHTAITFLLEAGVPTLRVKDFSGHHSLASLEKYAHARDIITNNPALQIPY